MTAWKELANRDCLRSAAVALLTLIVMILLPVAVVADAARTGPPRTASEPVLPTGLVTSDTWTALPPPFPRMGHVAVFDSANQRMIVFGGEGSSGRVNDVWSLSLSGTPTWTRLATAGAAPPAFLGAAAVYDAPNQRMLVFGGHYYDYQTSTAYDPNDVWALSLSGAPAWSLLTPSGTPPPGGQGAVAVYDSALQRMIIFGGSYNQVWALSLAGSPAWTQLTATGTGPSGRWGSAAIFDPAGRRMILFSGGSSYPNDVWALSLADNPSWTQVLPAGIAPIGRQWSTGIYVDATQEMVVFGGSSGTSYLNDVWRLSLAGTPTWSQITSAGSLPIGRRMHTAVFDPVGGRMIIFGGENRVNGSLVYRNDVWSLGLADPPTWSQLAAADVSPPARVYHAAVYDETNRRMIVFGGFSLGPLNDIWSLSLSATPAWTQIFPGGTPPVARIGHSAIYDRANQRMIVFGGRTSGSGSTADVNEVWALSLSGSALWTQITPSGDLPAGRSLHSAVYDSAGQRMIVFGGTSTDSTGATRIYSDTWTLSLSGEPAWTQIAPTGAVPAARLGAGGVYDSPGQRMVMFGGWASIPSSVPSTYLDDVWSLALSGLPAWSQLSPSGTVTPTRRGQAAVYDAVNRRMVTFGGDFTRDDRLPATYFGDSWALSLYGSTAWSQLSPGGALPLGRTLPAAIYDAANQRMVVFGGVGNGGFLLDDTWFLNLAALPTPTPTVTHTPTPTPIPSSTLTPTTAPSDTPTATTAPTDTATPTITTTVSPTLTPTPTYTPTVVPTSTGTPTPTASNPPTSAPTPFPASTSPPPSTQTPTSTPIPTPTQTSTLTPIPADTRSPTPTSIQASTSTPTGTSVSSPTTTPAGTSMPTETATSIGNGSAFATSTVVSQRFGVSLSAASPSRSGPPGTTVLHSLSVTNTGTHTDTVNLRKQSTTFAVDGPTSVGEIASGATTVISLTVRIPVGAAVGTSDLLTVIATSAGDGTKTVSATLTTVVLPGGSVYLPEVLVGPPSGPDGITSEGAGGPPVRPNPQFARIRLTSRPIGVRRWSSGD